MKRSTVNSRLSWYILLRDAIKLAKKRPGINENGDFEWCECCTCGKPIARFASKTHAGHFITKGMGGGSGVYFDERNVHSQCYSCNKWEEGNQVEYYPFMLKTYGQKIIDELRRKHHLPRPHSIDEYGVMYLEAYKELLAEHGLDNERRMRKVGKPKKCESPKPISQL